MTADSPQLSRRDALAALAAGGIAVVGGAAALRWDPSIFDDDELTVGERDVRTLVAVAEVVYPSEVVGISEFVEAYTVGRLRDQSADDRGVADATRTLDSYAREWYDASYAALPPSTRDSVLHEMTVHQVDPDPDGLDPERVRYYVVNELLYALYTSPTGGRLVGIENPQGHPGGIDSYQRGPGQ